MAFDDTNPPRMTPTSYRASALTAASALALYEAATNQEDKLRAAAAMAHVLRQQAAKPKRKRGAIFTDLLSAETLGAAVKRLGAVVERHNSIPVLSCILMRSDGRTLRLTATDLDMEYEEVLRGEGLPVFAGAVPADKLAAALRGAKGEVTFSYEVHDEKAAAGKVHGFLIMTTCGVDTRFPCLGAGDFPFLSAPQPTLTLTMPADALLAALGFVMVAVSTEETRYYLNGVYLHAVNCMGRPELRTVSTDGHRLMLAPVEAVDAPEGFPGVLIPRKVVGWLLRHLPAGEEVEMQVFPSARAAAGKVRFTTVVGTMTSKLIDGSFPDIYRVIPSPAEGRAVRVLDPPAAAGVIHRLASQSNEKSRSAKFTIDSDGVVSACVRNLEAGQSCAEIPGAEADPGEAFEIGFNASYMMAALAAGSGPAVVRITSPAFPARIDWPEKPGHVAVLMPLRV